MSSYEFAIPVHDLDAAGKAFTLTIRPAWLRGALEGTDVAPSEEEGAIDVRLCKSGHDVVVRGRVRVTLIVPCARCLEPARVPIAEELTALAVLDTQGSPPRAIRGDRETEPTAGDADTIPYDGETVVLDDLVRDVVLLGVPMIPLCSESCADISQAGISQEAGDGAEQVSPPAEVDPRLKPLLSVKKS
ncbi:MAG TPA: DUF177 domain-containing protein [Polyangiaceae bacterium]|nr:DUF177 domain-containing protein [Polyangiaceae bacterium]